MFAINVPIGVALLLAIPLAVPGRSPSGAVERGLDIPGAVLVTAGTGEAIYGLINVGSHGWAAASTVLPLVLAATLWAAFAIVERRARRPLLTVRLLGRRPVLAGSFLMLAATGLMVGGFFVASFALQHAHHYSALHVGLVFLPIAVAAVAGAQGGSRVLARVSARVVAVTGFALAAAGYAIAASWTESAATVTGLSIAALGIGATFVTAFTAPAGWRTLPGTACTSGAAGPPGCGPGTRRSASLRHGPRCADAHRLTLAGAISASVRPSPPAMAYGRQDFPSEPRTPIVMTEADRAILLARA